MAGGPVIRAATTLESAILFEFFATLIFVIVILGSTQKSGADRIRRACHRHYAGRHSHLRHSHHGCERESGAQPGAGAFCGRASDAAVVALSCVSERGRRRGRPAVPDQAARSRQSGGGATGIDEQPRAGRSLKFPCGSVRGGTGHSDLSGGEEPQANIVRCPVAVVSAQDGREQGFDFIDLRETVVDEIESLLAPVLRGHDGHWTADYVRLRFFATT